MQAFHICANDGAGGLVTYRLAKILAKLNILIIFQWSVLCPNGTIFNQEAFVCDWWFNFDCAAAEGLYGKNDENAAEAAAAAPQAGYGAASYR